MSDSAASVERMNPDKVDLLASAKKRIFDVLIEHAGAWPSDRESFMRNWPACREFRFQGDLGFGGKVWYRDVAGKGPHAAISCYPEDLNDERESIIRRTNKRLAEIAL